MTILHLTKAYHSFVIRVEKKMLMEKLKKKATSQNTHADEKDGQKGRDRL